MALYYLCSIPVYNDDNYLKTSETYANSEAVHINSSFLDRDASNHPVGEEFAIFEIAPVGGSMNPLLSYVTKRF